MTRYLSYCLFFLFCFSQLAQARLPDFADLIEHNSPAVVKITTVQKVGGSNMNPFPYGEIPEIFRDFFERRQMPEREARGMGSGFIISKDGYLLTNNHVIENADEITVRLIDRREFAAEVVGTDPRSDLALLKIDADDLPVVRFADPDSLRVGEWVVAIGSPFGLDYSASAGIVSAIGRSIPTPQGENYVPFIQSDVAINPGNSGGPLFNMDGEVVGINSQIYTRSGGSIGLSFAIPVSVALDVVAQLKGKGYVERGWLGVYIQDVNRDLALSLGLDKPRGALVAQVMPDSPAEDSGLEAGDVIVEFNDVDIVESGDLPHQVGLMAPGEQAEAVVIREGRKRTLDVEVGALPRDKQAAADQGQQPTGDILGLDVEELDDDTRASLRIPGGVVVSEVYPGTAAVRAGLQPGDVIVQLGNQRIGDLRDYRAVLDKLPREVPVLIRFLRNGQFIFRTIELR
jgi:serine protease Do